MYVLEESLLAQLTISDAIMPAQYYEGVHARNRETDPVRRLMLAVLEDAMRCLVRDDRSNPETRKDFAEARMWIQDRRAQGPFAFETICEALGIHPDYLRRGILHWRKQFNDLSPRCLVRRSVGRTQLALS